MKNKTMEFETRAVDFDPADGFEQPKTPVVIPTVDAIELYNEQSFTVPELAEKINKSVTVTRRYIDAGLFPNVYKDGPYKSSKWRIPKRDLDTYLAKIVQSDRAPETETNAENNERDNGAVD